MRKPQSQPSLTSLSEAEREQLAEWLRREEYHTVLAQVNRPRPDGFGLAIKSDKPLRTFYAKVGLFDLINARLPENKKLTLALFESLARRDIYLLTSADNERLAEAHEQIIRTATDLASDAESTPAQLLTLQRITDFPERAALRAAREERAQAKEERSIEAHAWKREWLDHKKELDQHRKKMDDEKLKLSREKFEATRSRSNSKLKTQNSTLEQSDHLGPLAKNWEDVRERARVAFGLSHEEAARRAELRRTWVDPNATSTTQVREGHIPLCPTSISRDVTTSVSAAPAEQNIELGNPVDPVNPVELPSLRTEPGNLSISTQNYI